jgi:hypothetical protein
MPEWWTYTLSDLQSFSLQTNHRLFELYNAAVWPAHAVALALGLFVAAHLVRAERARGRLVAAVLGAGWLWVAIAFHATRYATIHRAAVYFAWGFGLQALLLFWTGVVRGNLVLDPRADALRRAGLAIFLFALFIQPLFGLLFGREWRSMEVFGVAPDPTAVATLGVLLTTAGAAQWGLLVIPLLWCLFSGATLLALESREAWVPLAAAALVLSLAIARSAARRRNRLVPTNGGRHGPIQRAR